MPRCTVPVTCGSSDPKIPCHKTTGIAPSTTSPLVVTRVIERVDGKWVEQDSWCITHRPTGYRLGDQEWTTSSSAFRVLLDCDPDFAGWHNVKGFKGGRVDPTTMICREKFYKAVGVQGVRDVERLSPAFRA